VRIAYFVIVPRTDKDYTLFQGYNQEVVEGDFLNLLSAACLLPHSLLEIYLEPSGIIECRKNFPGKDINILGSMYLDKEILASRPGVVVILCLPQEIEAVKRACGEESERFIILSLENRPNVIDIKDGITPYSLDERLHSAANSIKKIDKSFFENRSLREKRPNKIDATEVNHAVAVPNQVCLNSLGFIFDKKENFLFEDSRSHVKKIIRSAEYVINHVHEGDSSGLEFVIHAPSMYAHLYDFNSGFWNQVFRRIQNRPIRDFIKNGVFKNKGYSGFKIRLDDGMVYEEVNPYNDPIAGPLLFIRQKELAANVLAISMIATDKMSPCIRLPNSVNLYGGVIKEIDKMVKKDGEKARKKLYKKFSKLTDDMLGDIDEEIIAIIRDKAAYCTICSDVPIEWLRFDKVPLMFSHETSRIPVTPGNMFFNYASFGLKGYIKESQLKDILIIRSFKDGDAIKYALEAAVRNYIKDDAETKIKVVDVKSEAEVISEMNRFEGSIVVFDCHGDHGGRDENGWLKIGDERLDTWELAHKARVPPIVMLSACYTMPISGSHASVANGFLRSGALSVIGTFLPVDARQSAIFMARIIYRIEAFLPAIKSLGCNLITWRTFISGFLRMSYMTDVLYCLRDNKVITEEKMLELRVKSNVVINNPSLEWFGEISSFVEKDLNKKEGWLGDYIHRNIPFSETMHYCQLGKPENIVIVLD